VGERERTKDQQDER